MSAARRAGCRLGPARAGRVIRLAAGGLERRHGAAGGGVGGRSWRSTGCVVSRIDEPAPQAAWSLEGAAGRGRVGPLAAPLDARAGARAAGARRHHGLVRARPARGSRRGAPASGSAPRAAPGRRLLVRCFQDARVPRSRRARLAGARGARRGGMDSGRLPLRRPPSGTWNGGDSRRC